VKKPPTSALIAYLEVETTFKRIKSAKNKINYKCNFGVFGSCFVVFA